MVKWSASKRNNVDNTDKSFYGATTAEYIVGSFKVSSILAWWKLLSNSISYIMYHWVSWCTNGTHLFTWRWLCKLSNIQNNSQNIRMIQVTCGNNSFRSRFFCIFTVLFHKDSSSLFTMNVVFTVEHSTIPLTVAGTIILGNISSCLKFSPRKMHS